MAALNNLVFKIHGEVCLDGRNVVTIIVSVLATCRGVAVVTARSPGTNYPNLVLSDTCLLSSSRALLSQCFGN